MFDGGSLFLDIITIVTLDEAENPNKTYRYADRNSYVENLFNSLNEAGVNVIWTSKAKPVWVGDKKVPGLWEPDCHQSIPYSVDVNVQMVAEPHPEKGQAFYGVIGTNAFNPALVGKRFANLDWAQLMVWLGGAGKPDREGEPQIRTATSLDSSDHRFTNISDMLCERDPDDPTTSDQHLATNGDFREVQR